mmetsp:Transcript_31507/g.48233  ORF Transcript_31507/g.48233 Transcript_31507/m.48233 type:complete len:828 (+) Transcript_31507:68-2551(+)
MPVDEFGREIPSLGSAGDPSARRRSESHDDIGDYRGGGHHYHRHSSPSHGQRYRGNDGYGGSGGRMAEDMTHSGGRGSSPRRTRSASPSPTGVSSSINKSYEVEGGHGNQQVRFDRSGEEAMLCQYIWAKKERGDEVLQNENADPETTTALNEKYKEYRKQYCLNYIRLFFNDHLDDGWFRSKYSPLGRKQVELLERERAALEASRIMEEVQQSTSSHKTEQNPIKVEVDGETQLQDVCEFVRDARLGYGQRAGSTGFKRKLGSDDSMRKQTNPVPKSHTLSIMDSCLQIEDIPPDVSDANLLNALATQGSGNPTKMRIFSSTVGQNVSKGTRLEEYLWRDAFVVFESAEERSNLLSHLTNSSNGKTNAEKDQSPLKSAIPKRDMSGGHNSSTAFKLIPLMIDTSDPYGRQELDGVPVVPKDSTVYINPRPLSQSVIVLSTAVSSQERINGDRDAAIEIARALDVGKGIPAGSRLPDILEWLNNHHATDDMPAGLSDADQLDVTISYLRRVHLFSFYNGCTSANGLGDVLRNNHPSATIHLRLQGADEFLRQAREEHNDIYGDLEAGGHEEPNRQIDTSIKQEDDTDIVRVRETNARAEDVKSIRHVQKAAATDLLVMRLDESIERALREAEQHVSLGESGAIMSEELDAQANEIEEQEERTKADWVQNQSLMDQDGRGRCAFGFCRKLFKDESYLRKHLIKKHSEYLKAELAQCHDDYMMKAWDAHDARPVPPILVDCGRTLGYIESAVTGREPLAEDPEPALWAKEQKLRDQRVAQEQQRSHEQRSKPAMTFEDVDDMKEVKVEMSFDTVIVPQPKKKKKKKKLL